MPDNPISTNTEDLAVTEYDAQSGADAIDGQPPTPNPPQPAEAPEVGLSQKGAGDDAVVKRETDV